MRSGYQIYYYSHSSGIFEKCTCDFEEEKIKRNYEGRYHKDCWAEDFSAIPEGRTRLLEWKWQRSRFWLNIDQVCSRICLKVDITSLWSGRLFFIGDTLVATK